MKAEETEEIRRVLLPAQQRHDGLLPNWSVGGEALSAIRAVGKHREALGRKSSSQESLGLSSHCLSLYRLRICVIQR